jgi:hypothetical protein
MTVTLLDSVNLLLKRVGLIAGDAMPLTTLTDSARQRAIDLAIQVIGEGVDELFTAQDLPMPLGVGEGTISLDTGVKAYQLAANMMRLRFPIIDRVNRQFWTEFPGGYEALLASDPSQSATGLPNYACIRPTDGWLFLDRTPQATEDGKVYTYEYDKALTFALATDVMPFSEPVARGMVPAWAQLWKREMRGASEFDTALFTSSLGRAARLLTRKQSRTHYSPRGR